MTIQKALSELFDSEAFKIAARQDGKLRLYLGRFKKGALKNGAATELLLQFGYRIEVYRSKARD